jgi:prevent-host-death family protein
MITLGIFEVKARISEICERVKQTGEPIVITKRGVPMVRIEPIIEEPAGVSEIWRLRQEFIEESGELTEDFEPPERQHDRIKDPLDE